jgi:hypothetical protein
MDALVIDFEFAITEEYTSEQFPKAPGSVASIGKAEREIEWPGFGMSSTVVFKPSVAVSYVTHGSPSTFATNRDGRLSNSADEVILPMISIGAQFIYISRLPTLLN